MKPTLSGMDEKSADVALVMQQPQVHENGSTTKRNSKRLLIGVVSGITVILIVLAAVLVAVFLRAKVTDEAHKVQKRTVTVNGNLNTPQFLQSQYTSTILETTSLGTSVLQVQAIDTDISSPNNDIRYYFSNVSGNAVARFSLDSLTGNISVHRNLYGEPFNEFRYTVYAQDHGTPQRTSETIPVTIRIQRNSFAPVFVNEPYTVDITSSFFPGANIIQVTARDYDQISPYNTVTYSLIGDDVAPNVFTISPNSGMISYRTNADVGSDSTDNYMVRVLASDGGNPSLTDVTIVYLSVRRNLFSPYFNPTQYPVTILKSQSLGTEIVRVSAFDQDTAAPHNTVQYSLVGDATGLEYFQVSPSTGVVSLIKSVNADVRNSYELTITVRDLGVPSMAGTNNATLLVSVYRNQFDPAFLSLPYETSINRNVNTDSSVYSISVTDNDSQSPFNLVSVSVIGDDTAPGLFYLENTGNNQYVVRITDSANLTADTDNQYRLRLYAVDGSSLAGCASRTAVATLIINVISNIFPPVFSNIGLTISESAFVGSFICTLNATDADITAPENTVRYQIVGDGDAPTYFFINPLNGLITLLRSVENTQASLYRLRVQAVDGGFPTLNDTTFVDISVIRVTVNAQP